MPANRHSLRSLALATPILLFSAAIVAGQEATVQKLIERGSLDEAVQKAEGERDNPESTYLAAQAFGKMDNGGRANEEYSRLRERGEEDWKAIGESGAALAGGNVDEAMAAANRAVSANGGNPYAHYQVGVVASRQRPSETRSGLRPLLRRACQSTDQADSEDVGTPRGVHATGPGRPGTGRRSSDFTDAATTMTSRGSPRSTRRYARCRSTTVHS
jgi:hypothetical protein